MYSADAIIDSLRCVSMLSEHIKNWCSRSLGRANENLGSLDTNKPTGGPCKPAATSTKPRLTAPFKNNAQIRKGSSASTKKEDSERWQTRTKSFAEALSKRTFSMVHESNESFTQCMDKFRKLLYKDDDYMFLQEQLEADSINNFFKKIDNWVLCHSKAGKDECKASTHRNEAHCSTRHTKCSTRHAEHNMRHAEHSNRHGEHSTRHAEHNSRYAEDSTRHAECSTRHAKRCTCAAECKTQELPPVFCISGRSGDLSWKFDRQDGGGYANKKCSCTCCGCPKRSKKKPQRTFIEYDWTNYDWCAQLKEALKRRTTQLSRMKRELQLRSIRLLPNVGYVA